MFLKTLRTAASRFLLYRKYLLENHPITLEDLCIYFAYEFIFGIDHSNPVNDLVSSCFQFQSRSRQIVNQT